MKKIFFILLTLSGVLVRSQNYYMNVVNGQTITTCRGNVLPSWLCSFLGYAAYCNNENYTVTFYSGNPSIPLRISFLPLNRAGFPTSNTIYLENNYDFLRIYDGPNIASPLLANLTGAIATYPLFYTSTGPYLTVRFTSDWSNVDWGWFAILGCQPQNCNGNLPASDNCGGAPGICDLNGYCGNTSGWYTADNINLAVDQGGPFCGSQGSIENNSWIKFIPNSSSASITFSVSACSSTASGIQAALYQSPNCTSFNLLTCYSQSTAPGPFSTFNLSYNSFIPGQTYYIMVDGYAGNACNYTVNANTGVAVSTIVATGGGTICQGGSATLTAQSPQSPASYTWNTGQTTQSIVVFPGNTTIYTATISSGFCTETVTRQVVVNPIPTANAGSASSITCSNPTVTLNGSGAGAGGTYTWSGPGIVSGGNSPNPVVNHPGNYTLVVTSSAGCTSTNNAVVSVPINTTPPVPGISFTGSLTCATPTLQLNGSPGSGVTYQWSGPGIVSGNSTGTIIVNQGGTYQLTVTNTANNCTATISQAITQNTTAPNVTASASGSLNCTTNTVQITTTVTPSSGISYNWSGPGIVSGGSTGTITVNQGGTYQVTVTNTANNCTATTFQSVAMDNNVPSIQAYVSNSLNCTVTSAQISTTASPSGTYTYNWSGPGIVIGNGTGTITVNQGGTYQVTVTNTENNCTATISQAVIQDTTTPNVTASASGSLNCTTNTVQVTTTVTPSSDISYTWTGSGIVGSSNNSSVTVNQPGVYTVQVTNTLTGCVGTETISVSQVTVVSQFTADPTVGSVPLAVNFTNQSVGATSYTWNFGGLGSSNAVSPQYEFTQSGTYTVTLTASNGSCTSVYTLEIKVKEGLLIPELVTPNGDNKNDVWFIRGLDLYPDNEVEIYNRWGNLVYKMKGYDNTWDGRPNQSSMGRDRLPVGTYFYIVYLKDKDNTVHKGFLKLEY